MLVYTIHSRVCYINDVCITRVIYIAYSAVYSIYTHHLSCSTSYCSCGCVTGDCVLAPTSSVKPKAPWSGRVDTNYKYEQAAGYR